MTAEAGELFHRLTKNGIPYRILRRGDFLNSGEYKIYVLHPYDGFYTVSSKGDVSNQNNESLVLKIVADSSSILFTGDIEQEAEGDLIYLLEWMKSDIIKIPHHGGRTSSSPEFIEAVHPDIAVVSSGRNNPFRHPHHGALQRYKSAGTRIFRTDMDGAVTVKANKGHYHVQTYPDEIFNKAETWGDELGNLKLLF